MFVTIVSMRYVSVFLCGLFMGSFLNVLIDRIPRNEPFWKGRSHCEYCKHTLSWNDLVPFLSFLFLKGKCRYCKKYIGWKYPVIELTTGILFILTVYFWQSQSILYVLYYLIIVSLLLVIFFTDLFYTIIPDLILFLLGIISFCFIIFTSFSSLPVFLFSAFGAFFFFFFLFAITNGKGIGFGDVKFAFVMGIILGWGKIFLAIYIAFLIGAIFACILVFLRKKKFFGETIPFGPFLVIGTFVTLFWGDQLWLAIVHRFFNV